MQGEQGQPRADQQRQGHAQALARHSRRLHRQATPRATRVERLLQIRAVREQRGGVAVFTHAQHQYVDGRQFGQCGISTFGGLLEARRALVQADQARRGGRPPQQVATQQAFIAVGMADRHPALVGEADGDLGPIQLLLRQALEEDDRATAAGHHQRRRTAFGNRAAQRIAHGQRQFAGQLLGVTKAETEGLHRQIEIRDRHTNSCHHG